MADVGNARPDTDERGSHMFSSCLLSLQKQKEKDGDRLGRWKVDHLNRLLDLLDLPRGSGSEGTKVLPLSLHASPLSFKSKNPLLKLLTAWCINLCLPGH